MSTVKTELEKALSDIEYEVDCKTGCMICISHSAKSNGYPRKRHPKTGLMVPIRRIVAEAMMKRSIEGEIVVSTCKNTLCVNPEHLSIIRKKEYLQKKGIIEVDEG